MDNPWIMKMEQFTRFSEEERRTLDRLISERQAKHAENDDIIREGEHSPDCHVVLSGLACRSTLLPDGRLPDVSLLRVQGIAAYAGGSCQNGAITTPPMIGLKPERNLVPEVVIEAAATVRPSGSPGPTRATRSPTRRRVRWR